MRVILFQHRFIQLIGKGVKTSTIRERARCKPGDTLSLRHWIDKPYRSKQREIDQVLCTHVQGCALWVDGGGFLQMSINGNEIKTDDHRAVIAWQEGFIGWSDLESWFFSQKGLDQRGKEWRGEMIEWKPFAY